MSDPLVGPATGNSYVRVFPAEVGVSEGTDRNHYLSRHPCQGLGSGTRVETSRGRSRGTKGVIDFPGSEPPRSLHGLRCT